MASFEKRGSSIRAIVKFPAGKCSATFDTLTEARACLKKHQPGKTRSLRHRPPQKQDHRLSVSQSSSNTATRQSRTSCITGTGAFSTNLALRAAQSKLFN